mgnify:CR=1 FL=1
MTRFFLMGKKGAENSRKEISNLSNPLGKNRNHGMQGLVVSSGGDGIGRTWGKGDLLPRLLEFVFRRIPKSVFGVYKKRDGC